MDDLQLPKTPQVPDAPNAPRKQGFEFGGGVVIAMIVVVIAIAFGITTLFGASSSQYQGFIKKVETQTEKLQESSPIGIDEVSEPTEDLILY